MEYVYDVDQISADKLKSSIYFAVINYEKNTDKLKKVPHKRVLDLALIYVSRMNCNGKSVVRELDKDTLDLLEANDEQLESIAMGNAKVKDEIVIRKMSDLIDCCGREDFPMKVITNNAGFFGASYSFTKEGAKYLSSHFGEDMFIIPSSVHELIAVPYCDGEQARYNEIIRHVNKTELAEGEFLSDHVYVLDHKEKTIRM